MATAEQLPRVQPTGGIQDIANLFSSLNPMMGGGDQVQTATKVMDPGTLAQLQQLLGSILGQNDSAMLDEMVGNILERAKQTFAPIIGQSIASGARAYSDTTLQQLSSEAMARATAEAAQVKLEAINKNNALATQLIGTQAANTGTTQTNIDAQMSPLGKLLGLAGIGAQGYSIYNKVFGKKPAPKPEQFPAPVEERGVQAITGAPTNPADAFAGTPTKGYFEGSDPSEFSPFGGGGGFDTGGSPAEFNPLSSSGADITALFDVSSGESALQTLSFAESDLAGLNPEGAISLAGGGFDSVFDAGIDVSDIGLTMIDDVGATAAESALTGAAESGFEGAIDVAGDAVGGFLEGGLDVFTGSVPVIGPLINVAQGDYGAAAGAVIGSVFGPIGTFVGGAVGGWIDEESVICTFAYQQGDISRRYAAVNCSFGRANPDILRGYQLWGRPFVKIMRRSKLAYSLGKTMAIHHAKYVSGERSIFGFFLNKVIAPLSALLWKLKGAK